MASVSSLDKDLRKMRLDKFTPQAANEVRAWIESILGERLAGGDLLDALKDGVALCKLVNLAVPSPGVKFKASAMPFVQMENISLFLRACQLPPLNLQPHDVFLTVDLYEQKDPTQVLQCIGAFSRVANQVQPSRFPTAIGPKSRSGVMSPQGTGTPAVGGGSFGSRARGASTASNTSSAYNQAGRTGAMTPTRTGEVNTGRWSPTKNDKLPTSPGGGTSSWSKKTDEGVTAPAWNIAQYGYMGGASQGNMGIAFGGRRQITSAGPHVPNMAEKERKRKEQEAEEERLRVQAEEAEHHRRIEREAEEERARIEEGERWAAEERKLKEKAAEEKKRWEEDERRWKEEEERRQQEEREAEERLEKETRRSRATSDARLQGQFLSQYQAERGLARRDRSKSPGPSGRVQELERELELARDRERQYERERQERIKSRDRDVTEAHDMSSRLKQRESSRTRNRSRSRPRALSHKNSEDSWIADERDYLRKEWSKKNHDDTPPPKPPRSNQYADEAPPPQPPRVFQHTEEAASSKSPRPLPEPVAPIRVLKNNTGPSSRPRTDRYLSSNPAPQTAQPQTTYSSELGAFDSTAERDAEDRRRAASQAKTKAGGWASKSLLEREMEMERERQKEWEEGQKATAQAAKMGGQTDGVDGIGGGLGVDGM
ncbi:calponin [Pseudogymnoascus australis]